MEKCVEFCTSAAIISETVQASLWCKLRVRLTLMLQLGGILPPRRTFYPVALKPLGIVTKAFVTFPEYMWAKKC